MEKKLVWLTTAGSCNDRRLLTFVAVETLKEEIQSEGDNSSDGVSGESRNEVWHENFSDGRVQRPQRAAAARVMELVREHLKNEEERQGEEADNEEEFTVDPSLEVEEMNRKSSKGACGQRRPESSVHLYRIRRDRNNEASRKSRLNRKLREAVMWEEYNRLERQVPCTRARAQQLEKQVAALRKLVLASVTKSPIDVEVSEVRD